MLGASKIKTPPEDLIYIGKVYESCPSNNMLGADVWLDLSFPHVIYITGTRGSGKSFDLGVLIEGISKLRDESPIQESVLPITSILIDTQNQFWTLKYEPNAEIPENLDQLEALKRWRIRPNALSNVRLWLPRGKQKLIGDELHFAIRPRDGDLEEWCLLLGQEVYSSQGHIIRTAPPRTFGRQRFWSRRFNW